MGPRTRGRASGLGFRDVQAPEATQLNAISPEAIKPTRATLEEEVGWEAACSEAPCCLWWLPAHLVLSKKRVPNEFGFWKFGGAYLQRLLKVGAGFGYRGSDAEGCEIGFLGSPAF